ncbi:MAG: RNA polymerase-binding protein DksA [Rhodanobacteraceae bacterium]
MAKSKHGAAKRSDGKVKPSAKTAKAKPSKKTTRKVVARSARKPETKAIKGKRVAKGKGTSVKKAAKALSAKKTPKIPASKKAGKTRVPLQTAKPGASKKVAKPRAPKKTSAPRKVPASHVVAGHRTSASSHTGQGTIEHAPRKRVHQRPVGGVAARLGVAGGDEQTITREDGRYALPATVNIDLPKGYLPSAKEEYMNPKQLAYFRQKLKDWRDQLVEESRQTMENLREEVRDVGDDAERATRETENSLELRTRDRYRKLISKIEKALRKIEEGRYGFCEETDEEIGLNRLEARPIATLSLDAQERREHLQKQMGD